MAITEDEISNCLEYAYQMDLSDLPETRRAAVLVPLFWYRDDWNVLFTRRSNSVQDHKGEVSFPGGAWEAQDENLVDTALREAYEEIGLPPENVKILGKMTEIVSISNYWITPYIAKIQWPFNIKISEGEVARVFSIPLSWLSDPAHREVRPYKRRRDGVVHQVLFFQEYDGELLWGLTASMVERFLNVIGY